MNNLEENNMQNSDCVSPIENDEVLTHPVDNELNDEVEAVNPFVLEERFLSIWESMSKYMKNYLYITAEMVNHILKPLHTVLSLIIAEAAVASVALA